nr:ABC-2 transporter permease [uncultured Agathobaculum sp.]
MKAMLYADWLNFRQSFRSMLFILIVFAFAAFMWSGPMFFITIVVMLSIMMPATLCASDQAYGWDKLSLSLPILRREVVGSKYLMGLAVNLVLFALAAAMTVVYSWTDKSVPMAENLLCLFCGEIISLLLMGLMFIITFKFGAEKSRYILIGVVWIPILVMAAIVKLDIIPGMVGAFDRGFNQLVTEPAYLPLAAALLVALAIYASCYAVSVYTYQKKEL